MLDVSRLALFAVVLAVLAAGQGLPSAEGRILVATSTTTIDGYDFRYKPMPWWRGGALLALDDGRETAPEIRVFDKEGKVAFQTVFTIPENRLIQSLHLARSYDGTLAVEGDAYSSDSRGGTFIGLISPDGQQRRIVRTSPFAAFDIAFAADGTLWAAGRELVDGVEVNPNHNMIRRFDKAGNLLGSWIPKSSLAVDPKVGLRHPAVRSLLVSSRDRIGWYSVGAREYFEFSLDGAIVGRFRTLDLQDGMRVTGAGLCDDGGLYVGAFSRKNGELGGGVFTLDRQDGTWKRVAIKGAPAAKGLRVFACEGSELVAGSPSNLIWFKPERAQ